MVSTVFRYVFSFTSVVMLSSPLELERFPSDSPIFSTGTTFVEVSCEHEGFSSLAVLCLVINGSFVCRGDVDAVVEITSLLVFSSDNEWSLCFSCTING